MIQAPHNLSNLTKLLLLVRYLRDNKAARIVIGTNQDKTENTENGTFAGMRLLVRSEE